MNMSKRLLVLDSSDDEMDLIQPSGDSRKKSRSQVVIDLTGSDDDEEDAVIAPTHLPSISKSKTIARPVVSISRVAIAVGSSKANASGYGAATKSSSVAIASQPANLVAGIGSKSQTIAEVQLLKSDKLKFGDYLDEYKTLPSPVPFLVDFRSSVRQHNASYAAVIELLGRRRLSTVYVEHIHAQVKETRYKTFVVDLFQCVNPSGTIGGTARYNEMRRKLLAQFGIGYIATESRHACLGWNDQYLAKFKKKRGGCPLPPTPELPVLVEQFGLSLEPLVKLNVKILLIARHGLVAISLAGVSTSPIEIGDGPMFEHNGDLVPTSHGLHPANLSKHRGGTAEIISLTLLSLLLPLLPIIDKHRADAKYVYEFAIDVLDHDGTTGFVPFNRLVEILKDYSRHDISQDACNDDLQKWTTECLQVYRRTHRNKAKLATAASTSSSSSTKAPVAAPISSFFASTSSFRTTPFLPIDSSSTSISTSRHVATVTSNQNEVSTSTRILPRLASAPIASGPPVAHLGKSVGDSEDDHYVNETSLALEITPSPRRFNGIAVRRSKFLAAHPELCTGKSVQELIKIGNDGVAKEMRDIHDVQIREKHAEALAGMSTDEANAFVTRVKREKTRAGDHANILATDSKLTDKLSESKKLEFIFERRGARVKNGQASAIINSHSEQIEGLSATDRDEYVRKERTRRQTDGYANGILKKHADHVTSMSKGEKKEFVKSQQLKKSVDGYAANVIRDNAEAIVGMGKEEVEEYVAKKKTANFVASNTKQHAERYVKEAVGTFAENFELFYSTGALGRLNTEQKSQEKATGSKKMSKPRDTLHRMWTTEILRQLNVVRNNTSKPDLKQLSLQDPGKPKGAPNLTSDAWLARSSAMIRLTKKVDELDPKLALLFKDNFARSLAEGTWGQRNNVGTIAGRQFCYLALMERLVEIVSTSAPPL